MSGFLAYIFGPFLPLSGVAHAVGNGVDKLVDDGVLQRFFRVVYGVAGNFYVVVIFCVLLPAPFCAASAKGASRAYQFYSWAN